jgi:hypothetical protein
MRSNTTAPATQAQVAIDNVTTPSGSFDVRSGAGMHFDVHISSHSAYSGNFVMELFTRRRACS